MDGAGQGAGHSNTLLLTAGELRGIVAHAMRHAYAFQRLLHAALAIRCRHAGAIGQRQFHVLGHREVADQVEAQQYD